MTSREESNIEVDEDVCDCGRADCGINHHIVATQGLKKPEESNMEVYEDVCHEYALQSLGFKKPKTPSKDEHFNKLKAQYDYLTRECYDQLYDLYTNLTWDDIGENEDFIDIPLPMSEHWKLSFIENRLRYDASLVDASLNKNKKA